MVTGLHRGTGGVLVDAAGHDRTTRRHLAWRHCCGSPGGLAGTNDLVDWTRTSSPDRRTVHRKGCLGVPDVRRPVGSTDNLVSVGAHDCTPSDAAGNLERPVGPDVAVCASAGQYVIRHRPWSGRLGSRGRSRRWLRLGVPVSCCRGRTSGVTGSTCWAECSLPGSASRYRAVGRRLDIAPVTCRLDTRPPVPTSVVRRRLHCASRHWRG